MKTTKRIMNDSDAKIIIERVKALVANGCSDIQVLAQDITLFEGVELSDSVRSELIATLRSSINDNNASTIALIQIRIVVDGLLKQQVKNHVATSSD